MFGLIWVEILSNNVEAVLYVFFCGLTAQSTLFESCWDRASASWVLSAGSHKNHAKLKIHSTSRLTDFDEIYFI